MKQKILSVLFLGIATTVFAATYEENLALSRTPTNEITTANLEAIFDASIAVTNRTPIVYCRDKKLVSYEKIIEKLAGKHYFAGTIAYTAAISSNDVLRASTLNMLIDMSKTDPTSYYVAFNLAKYLKMIDSTTNYTRRAQIAKNFYNTGFVKQGTCIAFAYLSYKYNDKRLGEYAEFLKQYFDTSFNDCIVNNINDVDIKNLRFEYLYTYLLQTSKNFDRMLDGVDYAVKHYKQPNGHYCWLVTLAYNHPFFNACRKAYLSTNNPENKLLIVALADKKALNSTTALETLYTNAKLCKTKVDCALALNDVDKLIDTIKVVDNSIDVSTMNKVIIKLNAVNAGYRTEDLKLALKNINKKYTLKLYDNHDAWEPILAKVRAMIDVL